MVQLTPHGPPEERKQRGGRSTSVPGLGSVSKKQDQNSSKGTERETERKKNERVFLSLLLASVEMM